MTETRFFAGDRIPGTGEIDWLVVMGGPMGVYDTGEYPWLVEEKKFIRQAIDTGKVVIGICLGSQLIAEVIGGRVYRNKEKEIGWFPVKKTVLPDNVNIMNLFNETETVFHWHGDTFDIPDGAVHTLFSEACKNQCFIYGDKILALQFHLEVTEELLNTMLESGGDEIVPSSFIQTVSDIKTGYRNIQRDNELMYSILDELDRK